MKAPPLKYYICTHDGLFWDDVDFVSDFGKCMIYPSRETAEYHLRAAKRVDPNCMSKFYSGRNSYL